MPLPHGEAQRAFPRGCRVTFDLYALAQQGFQPCRYRRVRATVVGHSRDGTGVWVIREGNTSRECWGMEFLCREEAPERGEYHAD